MQASMTQNHVFWNKHANKIILKTKLSYYVFCHQVYSWVQTANDKVNSKLKHLVGAAGISDLTHPATQTTSFGTKL